MARHHGPVLIDTNAILECFRVGSWRTLSNGYSVETVEDCVTETQTGFQRRRPELQIDAGQLVATLKAVHSVRMRSAPSWRFARPISRSTSASDRCGRTR